MRNVAHMMKAAGNLGKSGTMHAHCYRMYRRWEKSQRNISTLRFIGSFSRVTPFCFRFVRTIFHFEFLQGLAFVYSCLWWCKCILRGGRGERKQKRRQMRWGGEMKDGKCGRKAQKRAKRKEEEKASNERSRKWKKEEENTKNKTLRKEARLNACYSRNKMHSRRAYKFGSDIKVMRRNSRFGEEDEFHSYTRPSTKWRTSRAERK